MTKKEEYFKKHIPHRIVLLITFRERFSPKSKIFIEPNLIPDLFRCSKDISMMMVRFLLGELGIDFKRKKYNPTNDISENWKPKFGIMKLTYNDIKNDSRYLSILEVLKTANRAVAHIEETDVNHSIEFDRDHQILFDAIDFTEEKIKSNLYKATGNDYQVVQSMLEDMNRMTNI